MDEKREEAPEVLTARISQTDEQIEVARSQERALGFIQAVKLYPKAIFWSICMSTALIMEGYDTALIKSLFALPAFRKQYGDPKHHNISAPWQSGLTNGSSVGQLLGLVVAGYLSERIGFRWTMIGGLVLAAGTIFIQFFAESLGVLETGQVLLGTGTMLKFLVQSANLALQVSLLVSRR